MKDIFNKDLIVGKEYLFYNDKNGILRVCYGIFISPTKTRLATLQVTKTFIVLNNQPLEEYDFYSKDNKVFVKPFKLVPVN
jgi:hypothetical protein